MALLVLGSLACLAASGADRRLALGEWGGEHVFMSVEEKSARLEFDCARGTVDEALTLDNQGRFSVQGRFVRERGGPTRKDEAEGAVPARYEGSMDASALTLIITLDGEQVLGPFRLTLGGRAHLVKCR
jgi:hypothetical protein